MVFTDANADANEALKKSPEAVPKKLDTRAQVGLLATETAQDQRTRLAEETRPHDAVSEKAPSPFDADLAALMTEFHIADTGSPKKNFAEVAKYLAREVQLKHGVPQEVCLGQALFESGWGRSGGAQNHFVVFGITAGKRYEGTSMVLGTQENPARFRTYTSIRDSFDDYGTYLRTSFPHAFEFTSQPYLFLEALVSQPDHKYCPDSDYVEKVMSVAEKSGLSFTRATAGAAPNIVPTEQSFLFMIKGFFKSSFSTLVGWMRSAGSALKEGFWAIASTFGFSPPEKPTKVVSPTVAPTAVPLNTPLAVPEVDPNWREHVENPNAPAFSFPKGTATLITSHYGVREDPVKKLKGIHKEKMHFGIDLDAKVGTPIYATAPGVVVDSRLDGGHGYIVTVRYEGSQETVKYNHLEEAGRLPKGTPFQAGTVLCKTGNTGYSTGPHLHLAAFDPNGKFKNPEAYLPRSA